MIGLLLLAIIVSWLAGGVWLANKVNSHVTHSTARSMAKVGIFIVVMLAPFADEIVGKYQFDSLCDSNGIQAVDVSRAKGKRVKLAISDRKELGGTIMPMYVSDVSYRDADNGQLLFQHKNYYAQGGWLMRYTPLSMGSDHSMFAGNGCGLAIQQRVLSGAQITVVN